MISVLGENLLISAIERGLRFLRKYFFRIKQGDIVKVLMRLSPPVIDYLAFLVSEKLRSATLERQALLLQCQKELSHCLHATRYKRQVPLEYSRQYWK